MKFDFSNPFKTLFVLWAAAWVIILPLMSLQAGITEDEAQHMVYGKHVLDWYLGRDKTAVESPFDDKGQWKVVTEGAASKTAINIYGGLVDGSSELIYRTLTHHFLGPFESKHIISSLFGALMFIFTGLICFAITDSWAIALLGLIIATFTPRIFGAALSNPKDIPFATMFAFSLLQIIYFLKELPVLRPKRLVLLVLSFSLAMGIRSGAAPLLFYFMAFSTLYLMYLLYLKELTANRFAKIFGVMALVSVLGYLGCALFWPWDMMNPILNPLRSLSVFKNLNSFNCIELFEGKWIGNGERPWYFESKWLYITSPLTLIFGCMLFFVLLPKFLKKDKVNLVIYALLVFSVIFPLGVIIAGNSNILNAERHVFFIVPSIIVLATLGWGELFKQVKDIYQSIALYIAFALILAEPALFIIKNNPVQAMYFSPVIGGEKGAFKNYEMDYWGYSIKPAVDWIEKNDSIHLSGKKARVRMWYGEQLKLTYYLDSSKALTYALCEENSTNWDYSITLPSESKYNHDLLYHWPPQGTVYEVKADGVPLCAVIKNPRITYVNNVITTPAAVGGQPVDPFATALAAGMDYYQKGNYNQALLAFKKCVSISPQNITAINDVVASYNSLKMFDDAIKYAQKGLAIDPSFQLLKNNLVESYKAKKTFVPTEAYYLNLGYNYYVQGDYVKTIEEAREVLKHNPNNSVAWNNMCCAYNSLKQYQKAIDAADHGLKIDPKSELLKNNRAEAIKQLGQK